MKQTVVGLVGDPNSFGNQAKLMLDAHRIDMVIYINDTEHKFRIEAKTNIESNSKSTIRHGIIAALINEALKGDIQAARQLKEWTDGKDVQPVELNHNIPATLVDKLTTLPVNTLIQMAEGKFVVKNGNNGDGKKK